MRCIVCGRFTRQLRCGDIAELELIASRASAAIDSEPVATPADLALSVAIGQAVCTRHSGVRFRLT
jgi:hypothetical protein